MKFMKWLLLTVAFVAFADMVRTSYNRIEAPINIEYAGTVCHNYSSMNCGVLIYDCDNGAKFICVQNVQVKK